MNDLIEALKTRLSSPIFGYFGLALLAFNWEALFYISVQEGDVLGRIKFFQEHTTTYSLAIWPLVFSFAFATIYPWVILLIARVTVKPIELKNMVQAASEHRVLLRRKQLDDARSSLLASAESELIERAKRDQELNKLQSEELKDRLRLELEQLRSERDSFRVADKSNSNHTRHKELMEIAGTYRTRAKESTFDDRESFIAKARELEDQAYQLLVKPVGLGGGDTQPIIPPDDAR